MDVALSDRTVVRSPCRSRARAAFAPRQLGLSVSAVPSLLLIVCSRDRPGGAFRQHGDCPDAVQRGGAGAQARRDSARSPSRDLQATNACGLSPLSFRPGRLPLATPVVVAGTRVSGHVDGVARDSGRSSGTLAGHTCSLTVSARTHRQVVAGLVATVLLALVIDALIQGIGWALTRGRGGGQTFSLTPLMTDDAPPTGWAGPS